MARRTRKELKLRIAQLEFTLTGVRRVRDAERHARRNLQVAYDKLLERIDRYFYVVAKPTPDDNVIDPDDVDLHRADPMPAEQQEKPSVPYDTPHYVWQAYGSWWYSDDKRQAHGPFDTQMQADIRMRLHHHNNAHGFVFKHVIDWDGMINPPLTMYGVTFTHLDQLTAYMENADNATE